MRFDLLEAFGLDPNIISILKGKYGPDLLPIQEKAFKENQILAGGNFIIFAVTSAGKTLVGEILSLFNAGKGKRVFYLVPTKALAEEKFEQFSEDYDKAGIRTVISTHDRKEFDERIEEGNFHIAVIVYEKLQALLAKKPGEVITKDEMYSHLWPDLSNPASSSNPYDRQISDHKRKITTQIKKAQKGKTDLDPDQIKDLIKTRRKVGYVLNLKDEEVFLLA